jgi:hypothetical protein
MRLSSLSAVIFFLASSVAFAQHSNTTSSAPAPSPAPSSAPSPAPSHVSTPASSPAPSFSTTSSAPASHSSFPSAPASVPQSHVAPAPSTSPNPSASPTHTMAPTQSENRSASTTPASRIQESVPARVVPQEKIPSESRIVSAPRIGQHPIEDEKDKRKEPDLRRRACEGKDCINTQEKMVPPNPDLRHHVCLTGPCTCAPGQTWGRNGCSGSGTVVPNNEYNTETACGAGMIWNGNSCMADCPAGQVWNGVNCLPTARCSAGEVWDGTHCVDPVAACAGYEGRAASLITELRTLKTEVQDACSQNPSGQQCADLQQQQQSDMNQYMALWNEAPTACHSRLPDPGSLM